MQRIKSWNRYSHIYPHLHNQPQEVVAALLGPTNTQRTQRQLGNFPLFPELSTQFLEFCCCCLPKTTAVPVPEKKKSYPRKNILSPVSCAVPILEKKSYPNCRCSSYSRKNIPEKNLLSQLSSEFLSQKKISYPRKIILSQKNSPIPTTCAVPIPENKMSYPRKKTPIPTVFFSFYPRKIYQKKYPIPAVLCSSYPRKKSPIPNACAVPIPEKISQKNSPIPTVCAVVLCQLEPPACSSSRHRY